MAEEQTLFRQATESYQAFQERIDAMVAEGGIIDTDALTTRHQRRRALDILDEIPQTVLFATSNEVKSAMYLNPLARTKSQYFKTLMNIRNIEDWNTWLRTLASGVEIPEPEEPHETARENVLTKLTGYVKGVHERYSKWRNGYPGIIFAVDDDFAITKDDFSTLDQDLADVQPKGGIKKIEGERVSDNLAIAKKYADLVEKHGTERDLSEFGLGTSVKSLPVVFEYYMAAAVGSNADNSQFDIYTHHLKVPGYLIPFDEKHYSEDYPVIWIPAVKGIDGKSMGTCVREAFSLRDRSSLDMVIGENVQRLKELVESKDTSGWKKV